MVLAKPQPLSIDYAFCRLLNEEFGKWGFAMCYEKRIGGKFWSGNKRYLKKELIETIVVERERVGEFSRKFNFSLFSFLGSHFVLSFFLQLITIPQFYFFNFSLKRKKKIIKHSIKIFTLCTKKVNVINFCWILSINGSNFKLNN